MNLRVLLRNCACLSAAILLTGAAAAQTVALTNATLIDGTGAPAQPNVTIVMEQGRIRDLGAGLAPPAGATVVDLAGKFVTPGIINGHGHVGPAPRDPQLRQYALYGVTTTTSMYFDPDDVQAFKQAQKAGDLRGARIMTVMYRFMSEPFRPGSEMKTPEEARGEKGIHASPVHLERRPWRVGPSKRSEGAVRLVGRSSHGDRSRRRPRTIGQCLVR